MKVLRKGKCVNKKKNKVNPCFIRRIVISVVQIAHIAHLEERGYSV